MVRGRNTKGMVVLLLLFIATSINATPNICNCAEAFAWQCLSLKPNVQAPAALETDHTFELYNVPLITVGEKIHKPSVNFEDSPGPFSGVHSLPAVPRAVPLALTGFFRLSPAKDHQLWLVIFIGLFLAVQTGLRLPPRMVSPVRFHQHSRHFSYLHAAAVNKGERSSSSVTKDKGPLYSTIDRTTTEHTFSLPGLTPGYLKALSDRSAQARHCIISSRLVLGELLSCFIQRTDNSFNEINLFVHFFFETISAHLARGPPDPLES